MTRKKKHIKSAPTGAITGATANAPQWQWLILLFLPFLLYFNTISHEYALDDAIVITENRFTQQGFAGIDDIFSKETFVGYFGEQKALVAGGRYRPLSLVTFAIEVELFGNNPHINHFINILLYALIGLAIYFLFFRLMAQAEWRHLQLSIPFLTAIFFLVHPVHTEAVANIKGRDELLGMLLSIATIYFLLRSFRKDRALNVGIALFAFFLALLSKENSYTYVLIIPAVLYIFTKLTTKDLLINSAYFLGVAIIGLALRQSIIGGLAVDGNQDLMNDPFVQATIAQKYATISYTLGYYLKLLIFPYPLTHDYYPYQIPLMSWSHPAVILSLITYIILGFYSIYGVIKKQIPALGIWLYLIPLTVVSNIVFPVGTFMSERFIFMPSLGFCLLLAWIVLAASSRMKQLAGVSAVTFSSWTKELFHKNKAGAMLAGAVIVIFSFLTIIRNPVWANNRALFLSDVQHSPNSAKMNNAAGGVLYDSSQAVQDPQLKRQLWLESKGYLEKAIEIYPSYSAAWTTLGNIYYFLENDLNKAMQAYSLAGDAQAMNNLYVLSSQEAQKGNIAGAQKGFRTMIHFGHRVDQANLELGMIQGKYLNDLDSSIIYFNKAVAINPNNAEAWENLGVAYAFKGQPAKALENFQRALQLKPNDPNVHHNIANAYNALGNKEMAETHLQRAQMLRQGG